MKSNKVNRVTAKFFLTDGTHVLNENVDKTFLFHFLSVNRKGFSLSFFSKIRDTNSCVVIMLIDMYIFPTKYPVGKG